MSHAKSQTARASVKRRVATADGAVTRPVGSAPPKLVAAAVSRAVAAWQEEREKIQQELGEPDEGWWWYDRDFADRAQDPKTRRSLQNRSRLRVVGVGSRRVTFDLGDGHVLKVAQLEVGRRSNMAEASTWRTAPEALARHLMPVVAVAPDGRWLMMSKSGRRPSARAIETATRELLAAMPHGSTRLDDVTDYNWGSHGGRPALMDYEPSGLVYEHRPNPKDPPSGAAGVPPEDRNNRRVMARLRLGARQVTNPTKDQAVRVSASRKRVADGVYELHAVARQGRKVVGQASGQVGELRRLIAWKRDNNKGGWAGDEWKMFSGGEVVGYFQSLWTVDDRRGRGVGRSLSMALVNAMDLAGADVVWLVAVPLDDETDEGELVRLYRSIGFEVPPGVRQEGESPVMVRRARRGPQEGAPTPVAGVILVAPSGRAMMVTGGPSSSSSGVWSIVAGKLERGEAPVAAAARELLEETGIRVPASKMVPAYVGATLGGGPFYAYVACVPSEVKPTYGREVAGHRWVDLLGAPLPSPTHRGFEQAVASRSTRRTLVIALDSVRCAAESK